jgi:hypothetical protein
VGELEGDCFPCLSVAIGTSRSCWNELGSHWGRYGSLSCRLQGLSRIWVVSFMNNEIDTLSTIRKCAYGYSFAAYILSYICAAIGYGKSSCSSAQALCRACRASLPLPPYRQRTSHSGGIARVAVASLQTDVSKHAHAVPGKQTRPLPGYGKSVYVLL